MVGYAMQTANRFGFRERQWLLCMLTGFFWDPKHENAVEIADISTFVYVYNFVNGLRNWDSH